MSKRKRQKRTTSQKILWVASLVIVGSMLISLILVALPQPDSPTPTPWPTFTPRPPSTATPQPAEPEEGPLPATDTPVVTPPISETPTLTATTVLTISLPTVTPSSAGDSRHNPKVVKLDHSHFDLDGAGHIMAFGNDGFMAPMPEQVVNHVLAEYIHASAQEEKGGVV